MSRQALIPAVAALLLHGCLWVDADSRDVTIPLKNVGGAMQLRVLEYNVLSTADRNAVRSGYPEWEDRRGEMLEQVAAIAFDVAAFEECAPLQVADLYRRFKDDYGFVIADDVSTDAILLYAKARFELIQSGRWLLEESATTHIPRLAVWASLRDRASQREFLFTSVHFDANPIKKQELKSFNHRLQKPASWGVPVVVAGDFNISPSDPEFDRMLTYGWKDAHLGADGDPTFPTRRPRIRIDHVFYLGAGVAPAFWAVQDYPRAYALSDHFPIVSWLDVDAAPDTPLGPVSKGASGVPGPLDAEPAGVAPDQAHAAVP